MANRERPKAEKAKIIAVVVKGLSAGMPLTVICSEKGMPCDDTIRAWADKDETIARAIARAREAGFDTIAHRVRETARGAGDSTADVQRDKLIIDTDLKLLAKWDPKRYGDKQLLGSDPDNPLPTGLTVTFRKTDETD